MTRLQAGPAALAILFLSGCTGDVPQVRRNQSQLADEPPGASGWFVDKAGESGLDFVHFNGMSGEFYYAGDHGARRRRCSTTTTTATSTSSSSRDRCSATGKTFEQALVSAEGPRPARGPAVSETICTVDAGRHADAAFHRRDRGERHQRARLRDGRGGRRLQQRRLRRSVRHEVRPQPAVPQQLRRHVHRRVEGEPAPTMPGWSVSAAFVDYDRDGWLDLFVGHYLNYSIEANIQCFSPIGQPRLLPAAASTARSRATCITTTATARSPT